MSGRTIPANYRHPLDCGHGCHPPTDNEFTHAWDQRREHERWVCPHGAGYELYFRHAGAMTLDWRRLGPVAAWFARRQARHIEPYD